MYTIMANSCNCMALLLKVVLATVCVGLLPQRLYEQVVLSAFLSGLLL